MATALKNLSDYDPSTVPSALGMRVGIVVSEWNDDITFALRDGAVNTLIKHGARESDIMVEHVPGSYELVSAARSMVNANNYDAVICIGCVIQGDTPHFTYICQGVTQGLTKLNVNYDIPFIFGVLTTNTHEQAKERAGGKHGNKGDEAAITAIKMIALNQRFK